MLPPWMIEKLEQDRREREARERPRLEIEIQPPSEDERRPERQPTSGPTVIVIDLW